MVKRNDFGEGFLDFFSPEVLLRQVFGGGHDDGHDFPIIADTPHDVADAAFSGSLIVAGNAMADHEIFRKAEKAVVFLFLNEAFLNRDDLVRALAVVAKNGAACHLSDRDGHFISVIPFMRRAKNRKDDVFACLADADHDVLHAAFLRCQLALVGQMGNLASSAGIIDRALGHRTVGRRLLDGNEFPGSVRFLDQDDPRLHRLSRKSSRNEDSKILRRSDAFAMDTKIADLDRIRRV